MTKNPLLNALCASLYIVLLVSAMFYAPFLAGPDNDKGIIFPITILSLLVFSASLMGYIFLYQPIQLFLEGHKKEAVNLFLLTVASFAGVTLALVLTWVAVQKLFQ